MAKDNGNKRSLKDEDDVSSIASQDYDDDRGASVAEQSAGRREEAAPARGFFDIYKPTQGKYTRMLSGAAAAVLIVWGAMFLHKKLSIVGGGGSTTQYIQVGSAVLVTLIGGLFAYRALGLNRRVGDFLIATEGEMKKVAWTSKQDLSGSTKVVIGVVLAMATFLFLVDIGLMWFFTEIKVLRIMPDAFRRLLGGE